MNHTVLLTNFHSSEDELLTSLGRLIYQSDLEVASADAIGKDKAIERAKQYLQDKMETYRVLLCEKHRIQNKVNSDDFDSISSLVQALTEILTENENLTFVSIIAIYIVKKGINSLCSQTKMKTPL